MRVTSAGIQEVSDATIPFGPMRERVFRGPDFELTGPNLPTIGTSGVINFSMAGAGVVNIFPSSDPRERIVGIEVMHDFNGVNANVAVVRTQGSVNMVVEPVASFGFTGSTDFPADETVRSFLINAISPPLALGGDFFTPPLWGGGYTRKHDGGWATERNEGLGIYISSNYAVSTRKLYGVRVFSVVG